MIIESAKAGKWLYD
ncbi:DUF1493 family protein [Mangrovibacter sp. SLW1]